MTIHEIEFFQTRVTSIGSREKMVKKSERRFFKPREDVCSVKPSMSSHQRGIMGA